MNKIILAFLLALSTSIANADQLDEANAAYMRGDYSEAEHLLRPLAEQGIAIAQNNLGVMYGKGKGVPQDDAEAVRWYRMAAEQGLTEAQKNLGVMYAQGKGVPQDYVEAYKWFDLPATKGDAYVAKFREFLAESMTPAEIAEAQKQAREWRPK